MSKEAHIYVTGLVQGVGFRSVIKRHALLYDIKGYARNLPDGRVEICAQGKEEHIYHFIEMVQSKPGLATIAQLETNLRVMGEVFYSFDIR